MHFIWIFLQLFSVSKIYFNSKPRSKFRFWQGASLLIPHFNTNTHSNIVYRVIQNLSFKFYGEVKILSGNWFHIEKYVCKCMHVEGDVCTQLVYSSPDLSRCHQCTTSLTSDKMDLFTYQELVDMHLVYGTSGESCYRICQVFEDWYHNRRILQYQMFTCVHPNLWESFHCATTCIIRE